MQKQKTRRPENDLVEPEERELIEPIDLEDVDDLLDEIEDLLDSPEQLALDRLAFKERIQGWARSQGNIQLGDDEWIDLPCGCY